MRKNQEIEIIKPKPYEVVGVKFDLLGKIPKTWLAYGRYGLGVDWKDVKGGYLPMSGPTAKILPGLLFRFKKKVRFYSHVDLSYFTASEHPRGLILEISGDGNHSFLFPVIIQGTNKVYESEYELLKNELSNTIKRITKYKEDLKNYNNELEKIRKSVVYDKEILNDIFEILDNSKEIFKPFTESEEDELIKALEEKYKEAIQWRGPLFGGIAGRMDGFEFRVYSDDHDKHFHVVHKGKGVNARFSFPKMELMSYLTRTTIGTKTEQKIREFCEKPEIFAKLEKEFAKRSHIS